MHARRLPLLLVLLGACTGRQPGISPNYSEPLVYGYLYRVEYVDHSVEYDSDVQVSDPAGLRSVPVVTLNGVALEPYSYRPTEYRYGNQEPLNPEERYDLNVEHYWGGAFARAVMPGTFSLTKPPSRYILERDSTLRIAWSRSVGAQWYWIEVYADFDYYDSTGGWDSYSFAFDTLVSGSDLSLVPDRIFPGFVAELLEGDGSVVIWAGNGPSIEPGDVGNVRGAGLGFFNCINEPAEKYFYVGAPPASRHTPRPGGVRRAGRIARLLTAAARGRR